MTARALGAALIVLASGTAALAADLPVTAAPAPPLLVPRTWDWNGFYGGINGGGSFGRANNTWDLPTISLTATDHETQIGPLGGIQIGWNWQYGILLWGLEGDIDAASQRGNTSLDSAFSTTRTVNNNTTTTTGAVSISLRDELNWIGTLRGRLGGAFGPVLAYATGGFAWAAGREHVVGTITGNSGSAVFVQDTRLTTLPVGWTAGGGIEWAGGLHWSLRAEYLFIDLVKSDKTFTTEPAFTGAIPNGRSTIATQRFDNVARLGINYKFAPF
jgi:outer membrane immunogenic protein